MRSKTVKSMLTATVVTLTVIVFAGCAGIQETSLEDRTVVAAPAPPAGEKQKPPEYTRGDVPLSKLEEPEIPLFTDDLDNESIELAIGRSLRYYSRIPESREFTFGNTKYTVQEMRETLLRFLEIVRSGKEDEEKHRMICDSFDVYRSNAIRSNGANILLTGYYEPVIRGSLVRTPEYKYPIYSIPDDHVVINLGEFKSKYERDRIIARVDNGKVVPYYTRGEIDIQKRLEGKGLEIAWLADPVDIFFLQIQGSGAIYLTGGNIIQVSYAASNGHSYRSLGRHLVEEGRMEMGDISLRGIKSYLWRHPDEMFDILSHNESYVFFRVVSRGPIGSLGIPVTSGRTIATDQNIYPRGALAFILSNKPEIDEKGIITSWVPFSRFVLNQDTGGAFKGRPDKADLFCGRGRGAEIMAGHLKEDGELYMLVKKKQ